MLAEISKGDMKVCILVLKHIKGLRTEAKAKTKLGCKIYAF